MDSIVDVVRGLNVRFWDESFWFPPGVNWTTLRSTEFEKYPDFSDLRLPIYYAFLVLIIRAAFEWCIARPLGRAFGIVDTDSELSIFFSRLRFWYRRNFGEEAKRKKANGDVLHDDSQLNGDVAPASVASSSERIRSRSKSGSKRIHLVHNKSTLDKFAESCWRFTYYLLIFIYGCVVLSDKPWFWDSAHCWYGYPFQPISNDAWWYYMIELSFYWSLIFSQFVDVQRKDFWVNFVHHIATILLMSFSWANNLVRAGTMVLAIHDAADFWMEAAKMARYCNKNKLCSVLFVIFTIVWFATRVGLFPYRIILPGLIDAPALIVFYTAYYVFNMLLLLLLMLHVFWSIMILRVVILAMKSGEPDDVRSDDEGDDEDSESDGSVTKRPLTTLKRNGFKAVSD